MGNILRLLALIFLVSLLVACRENDTSETVVLVTETAVSPTNPSPTTTNIPTPSPTQTAVPPKPPTATATATTIPTLTPLPTFAPDELETAVADLLANPMNCDVPCWWGAIPGEITVGEIEQSLAPYQFYDYWYEETQQPNFIELWFDHFVNEDPIYFPVRYTFENHNLKTIYTGWAPELHEILRIHGQPDEIWLSILGSHRDSFSSIWLNLIYFEKKMAIGYIGNGTISGEELTGCFSDTKMRSVRINASVNEFEDDNFTSIYFPESPYLLLEDATDLTLAEFMEQFSDPNQPQCLETPTELWD